MGFQITNKPYTPWINPWAWYISLILLFLKDFIYLFSFRERGREGGKEEEKYQCVVATHVPPTRDLACNPGICLTGN